MGQWGNITGTMQGLTIGPQGIVNNYLYPGQMVASPTDMMNQYWGVASGLGANAPNVMPQVNAIQAASGDMYNTQVNPSGINLPQYNASSFQPGQLNLPQFGNVPTVSAPSTPTAAAYTPQQVNAPQAYTPQQVQAMMVNAPGSVNPITGVPNVSAPNLNYFQMQGVPGNVNAMGLQNYTMQAAPNVTAGQTSTPQSWTGLGTAQQYMNPYVQQSVNAQLAQAQVQNQQQLQQIGAQAAQAGAFGGTRQGVEEANQNIGYQQLANQIEASGLNQAYSQGMQQFNTEQQAQQQAQQFNVQSGLQAALSNQQMQQQANTQNLSAYLQTQGLQAQTGLQAQLANQQAGLTVAGQNLSANLQTQQLGAQTGLQAALANQQMNYQSQLANQQAQEFGLGQQMQASLANQQAGLTAQQANQQAGLQAGLAEMGYQYGASQTNAANALQAGLQNQQLQAQLGMFGAGQQMTAAQGNQAAQMQALGMTYQGGLQGALQTQNLGLSGAEFGGNLGLQSAAQQYGLQQSQQGLNMQALNNQAAMQNQAGNLAMQGYQTGLQGANTLMQAAQSNQSYDQAVRDAQYQQWQNSIALPIEGVEALAQMTAMQPLPYTMNNQYSGTQTMMPSQPSIFQQGIQGAFGALGAMGGLGFFRKGGAVSHGLGRAKMLRMPDMPRERRGLALAA